MLSKVSQHREFIIANHHFEKHRKGQIKAEIKRVVGLKIRDVIDEKVLSSLDLDQLAESVFRGEDDPYSAGERIFSQINIDNSGDKT